MLRPHPPPTLKNNIWLADLTHTGQSIASDTVPAAIGMISEALSENCPQLTEIELFKFPEDLSQALDHEQPRILGLSNYMWNFRISSRVAEIIKQRFPQTVVVMGGPNFPTNSHEQELFLTTNPWIDFYVVKEGELALVKLVNQLIKTSYKTELVDFSEVPNIVALRNGKVASSTLVERIQDLNEIPSPYLTGRLDSFLDGKLLPVIQTNRGCPFSCAFCTEGQGYWNKVRKKSKRLVGDEIRYIAKSLSMLPKSTQRGDLLIADSNFGMFPEDLETCDVISEVQENYQYPSYINVATGKNKKERVLEAARRVNGAMKLAGSVQSLDPQVQENMKRSNISSDQIVTLALQASEIGTNIYSEVILALPGDTKTKHYKTLQTLVEADFSTISMYQLMLLPGTEFGGETIKEKYGMTSRYRVIPRAFGQYRILGESFNIAEIEEICVAQNTLPHSDYLHCRRLNLMINLFFNDRIFDETIQVLRWGGLSVFDFLATITEKINNLRFEELVDKFLDETESELWKSQASLESFTSNTENMKKFVAGDYGSNLIFKFKALSLTSYFSDVCDALIENIRTFSENHGLDKSSALIKLLIQTVEYKRLQVDGIFQDQNSREGTLTFPIHNLSAFLSKTTPATLCESETTTLVFSQTENQIQAINSYRNIFGDDIPGLTRTLTRARITDFYRGPSVNI